MKNRIPSLFCVCWVLAAIILLSSCDSLLYDAEAHSQSIATQAHELELSKKRRDQMFGEKELAQSTLNEAGNSLKGATDEERGLRAPRATGALQIQRDRDDIRNLQNQSQELDRRKAAF